MIDAAFNGLLSGLSSLIEMLIILLSKIMMVLISGVVSLSEYSDFVNAAVVVNGWVIVRDVANMFFIMVLLIIAFGTILGQEEYHYKKLLPKMLMLAVLVNFSRTIIGVMIDFAQVVMLTFVNGYKVAAAGNFASLFQITKLMQYKATNCPGLGQKEIFAASVLALAMVVISVVTITVILIILALRIVMLWLLTVLSPIAFLCGTFPQGQEYYAQWWKEFKSQVMVGPVLAFFLWLSLVSIGSGNAANQITRDGKALVPNQPADGEVVVACNVVGSGSELISYVIGIMMLLTATQMAQQMGGVIAGAAGRAKNAAYKTLKFGAKTFAAPFAFGAAIGGRKLQRELLDRSTKIGKGGLGRVVKYIIAPTQSFAGLMKRGERLTEEARQRAFAASQEDADNIFTRDLKNIATFGLLGQGPAVTIPHQRLKEAAERDEYAKEYSHMNRTEFMAQAQNLMGRSGKEYEKRREALWAAGLPKGYTDDLMSNWQKQYTQVAREKYGMTDEHWHDNIVVGDFIADWLSGVDINKAAGTGRAHLIDNYRNEQGAFATMADAEGPGLKTGHSEVTFHQGPMEIEGKDTGKWKGSFAEFYDANDINKKINLALDDKELEQRLLHGNLKFKLVQDQAGNIDVGQTGWYDTGTGALAMRKFKYDTQKGGTQMMSQQEAYKNLAIIMGNHRQGDEAVGEVKKMGRNAVAHSPHGVMVYGGPNNGRGWEQTREMIMTSDAIVVVGEERGHQERLITQMHGDGARIDVDNLTVEMQTDADFLRAQTAGINAPKLIAATFARASGAQLRELMAKQSGLTIKGPGGKSFYVEWKKGPYGDRQMSEGYSSEVLARMNDNLRDEAIGQIDLLGDQITDQIADALEDSMKKLVESIKNVGIKDLGNLGGLVRKLSDDMAGMRVSGQLGARSVRELLDKENINMKWIKDHIKALKETKAGKQ